jgi:hypothetical protein
VERVTAIKVVASIEIVAIDDRSAVGEIRVVVVDHPMTMPVPSPVIPAPSKSAKEADSKPSTEEKSRAVIKDSGHWVPTRVGEDRISIHEPRIIGRDVDQVGVRRLDDNRVVLRRHLLLLVAIQVAGLSSLLAHRLDGIHHILLLVGIYLAKG